MKKGALNARLQSAAELVRQDAVFADIGTDHAYLPLFLLGEGRIKKAYCTDINKGPLASAKRNAKERQLQGNIEFILTDGARDLAGLGITDYAICGMGGELIADIIDRAPMLKDKSVSLILGPMTKQAYLRKYLYSSGFEIQEEIYSSDSKKHYVTFLVKYIGEPRAISETEAELGMNPLNCVNKTSQICYLKTKIASYRKTVEGKIISGTDASSEREVLEAVVVLCEKLEKSE